MKKAIKKRAKFIRRYIVSVGVAGLLVIGMVGVLTWYSVTTSAEVKRLDALSAQYSTESKTIAKETQARKLAEQEAAKAAEQAALAKAAAEQAKHSDGVTSSLDSTICNSATTHADPAVIDVVVNKKHCIQPLGYVPPDLTSANGATLSAKAIAAYKNLYAAAAAAGQPFSVTSSYRSYTTQISTYNRWVSISGAAGADTYSARPGYSEHQTGLAFDVAAGSCTLDCFGSTSQYQWLQAHAAEYGFIQRYYVGYDAITGYKAEEWHYRYVGPTVAMDMKAKGIKTLEEYWGVSGGDY